MLVLGGKKGSFCEKQRTKMSSGSMFVEVMNRLYMVGIHIGNWYEKPM